MYTVAILAEASVTEGGGGWGGRVTFPLLCRASLCHGPYLCLLTPQTKNKRIAGQGLRTGEGMWILKQILLPSLFYRRPRAKECF